MNFEDRSADLSSAKKVAKVELRQREIYRLASAEKREALLVQCRCTADVQNRRPTSENPPEMNFPTISTAIGNESDVVAFPAASDKQKSISRHSSLYVGVMAFEEKNSDLSLTKNAAEMKFRRREIYRLISAEKKEALLSQLRTNSLGLKRNTASRATAFHVQNQCVTDVQIHRPASQKGDESHIMALSAGSDKRENISPLFYAYEVGLTSSTANSQCDMASKNIQKKARRQYRKSCANMNQLQSEYVHLKTVPNCKFCGAERFEYEPPGFCCNNGSIKLVSNQISIERKGRYLEVTSR